MFQTIQSYLSPQPRSDWNAAEIRKVHQCVRPLQSLSTVFSTCGFFTATFFLGGQILRKIRGTVLTNAQLFVGITALALVVLGKCFSVLAKRHFKGLTDEKRLGIAVDELKKAFQQLTVCITEEELKETLANDASFSCSIARDAVRYLNEEILYLAFPRYQPTREFRARFDIFKQQGMTEEQRQDLLNTAFEKGILLRFNDFYSYLIMEPLPGRFYDPIKVSDSDRSMMQKAHITSVNFLLNRFQKGLLFDTDSEINEINEQLFLLAPRFEKEGKIHVFNPTVYLENEETVVIRGNCSEIGDPAVAVEKLAPYFKNIKIEMEGIIHSVVDNKDLLNESKWKEFQTKLHERFEGKLIFVNTLKNMPTIWQDEKTYGYQEPTLRETLAVLTEDQARIAKIKEKQKA